MRLRFKNEYVDKVKNIIKDKNYTFCINTMGCQLNENDSLKYTAMLEKMGFIKIENIDKANIVLFNTCCVRENAENTLFGRLGKLKQRKMQDPNLHIIVVGCMTQQKSILEKIKKSYRFVDIVLGTNSMNVFPKKVYDMLVDNKKTIDFVENTDDVIEDMPISYQDKYKASISIIYGCNNFCTYCIVPYVRGRERSRKLEDIQNEIEKLAKKGYKEIMLLGQNVNSYGKDLEPKVSFSDLLKQIEKIEGIEIIRFMSPHPKDFTDELIDTISKSNKIAKQIHLPLQSGSTNILNKMNRKHTKEQYLTLFKKIKEKVLDASFSTDIIVGFPGETEEDFQDTLDVVKQVKYDQIYMFIYSKRTGTVAANMEDNTLQEEKVSRLERLKNLYENILNENNEKLIGKEEKVLVEGKSKTNDEYYTGRSTSNKSVIFKANKEDVGKIIKVKINENHLWYLKGKKCDCFLKKY